MVAAGALVCVTTWTVVAGSIVAERASPEKLAAQGPIGRVRRAGTETL